DSSPGSYGDDPSLEREAAIGAFTLPYGFGRRYWGPYERIGMSFESPDHGEGALQLAAKVEGGSNAAGQPASGWLRYGTTIGGFFDFDHYGHALSLALTTMFVDPLGPSPVPFTELVLLGGEEPMLGFLPGRLVDRSAAVVSSRYVWPVAPNLEGRLDAAVGNVFGEHLQGFRTAMLRFSGRYRPRMGRFWRLPRRSRPRLRLGNVRARRPYRLGPSPAVGEPRILSPCGCEPLSFLGGHPRSSEMPS
ncbi:MAG TPA: hypothetical protein VMH39_07980, partial [Gemmatimonadaceae bacterium]|nr:hypothetical protein [Gemmatimonadaceae bacterium]